MSTESKAPEKDANLSGLGRALMGTNEGSKPSGPWVPPTAEELHQILPQYEIVKMLGRGGMGAVYMGRQTALDRTVAIKILSAQLEESDMGFTERFKNEARAMGKLNHPAIVSVYEFGQHESGLLYIVMEYVDGTDVAKMIAKSGRLHTEHAMAITAHVCDALAYAHERGIIHRDIKPANVMVDYDGSVKIADFGLAKVSTSNGSTLGLTQSGMAMGTLHFMAPEALMLGTAVDHRADIYAVGVMLYQMLTGKLPQGMFKMPSLQVPGLDPRYDGIIAKAMMEDRAARYQSAREMRSDLDGILTQPVMKVEEPAKAAPAALPTTARPQRPGAMPPRQLRATPAAPPSAKSFPWSATAVVLLLLAGAAYHFQSQTQAPKPVETSKTASVPGLAAEIRITTPDQVRVLKLEKGQPRLYDSDPLRVIEGITPGLEGWQFTSIPQRIDIEHTVQVEKSGVIYAFGALKKDATPQSVLGADFSKWEAAPEAITGAMVKFCFRRQVSAGEILRLKDFELQLAASSILLEIKPPAPTVPVAASQTMPAVAPRTPATAESSSPASLIETFNGHRYQFIPGALTWKEAKVKAESMGGHLATITTKEENEWLLLTFRKLLTTPNRNIWLGASEEMAGLGWKWVTGEPFTPLGWFPGEPNGMRGGGGQVGHPFMLNLYSFKDGAVGWNDSSTHFSQSRDNIGFIVEWDSASPETTTPAPIGSAPTWTDTKGRSLQALFARIEGANVLLVIAGKLTPVALETLSPASQQLARTMQSQAAALAGNNQRNDLAILQRQLSDAGASDFFATSKFLYAVFPKQGPQGPDPKAAPQLAKQLGGRLPIFHSHDEFLEIRAFAVSMGRKHQTDYLTLGVNRGQDGTVRWDDGVKVSDSIAWGNEASRGFFRIQLDRIADTKFAYQAFDPAIHAKPVLMVQYELAGQQPGNPPNLARAADTTWVPLFPNDSLSGWTGDTSFYRVSNGILTGSGRGDLISPKEYGNFQLKFDLRLSAETNSGLGIWREASTGSTSGAAHGFEVQIQDDTAPKYSKQELWQRHGGIYYFKEPLALAMNPVGSWNTHEIHLEGARLKVTINGKLVQDADVTRLRPVTARAPVLDVSRKRGHLIILGRNGVAEFRNMQIKELP
jgi:serine/threonine protein kinase